MDSLRASIANWHQTKSLIGFHCEDQAETNFFAGFVEEIEEDRFNVRYINVGGRPSKRGVLNAWFYFDEIVWAKVDTEYLNGLRKVHDDWETFAKLRDSRWIQTPQRIRASLRQCMKEQQVCRVRLSDEDEADVLVINLDREYASLEIIKEDGSLDGQFLARLDAVQGIKRGGLNEAALSYLARSAHPERFGPKS